MALVGVRFLRRSGDRGGQAPALRLVRRALISVGQDRRILPVRAQASLNYSLFKVRRTLMSIARADAIPLKVRRTLMFSCGVAYVAY